MLIDELLESLNGIQMLMTGGDKFNREFYDELVPCLNSFDPLLLESVNAQWKGFKEYASTGGNPPSDIWRPCKPGLQVV